MNVRKLKGKEFLTDAFHHSNHVTGTYLQKAVKQKAGDKGLGI